MQTFVYDMEFDMEIGSRSNYAKFSVELFLKWTLHDHLRFHDEIRGGPYQSRI
ncbi:hypothetical protein RchiOBHm_Chr7g0217481 [Rosa chinensis]|uniref:Uncharacterized protein n=1 Tax=Rosa chinensis TaxID=74649 RepID=A0A2P6PC21_ROSCH|nr:hypothetical protein RchiOBHm_Chr7g0217481 [Rosa chinensis]